MLALSKAVGAGGDNSAVSRIGEIRQRLKADDQRHHLASRHPEGMTDAMGVESLRDDIRDTAYIRGGVGHRSFFALKTVALMA
ncbi:hypothetical protein ACC862_37475, partial [Rhizobium ruizarguesonis]